MNDLDLDRLHVAWLSSVQHFPSLGSTNDEARLLAQQTPVMQTSDKQALLIVADEQTAGRGRGANRWWTGAGSLAFSLLIDPAQWQIAREDIPLASLAVAAAVVDVLHDRLPQARVGLHWPNDVFVEQAKIAGILTEGLSDGRLILGVGLNVNNSVQQAPAELQTLATSLMDLTDEPHDRTALLQEILDAVDANFAQLGRQPAAVGQYCHAICLQLGKTLHLDTGAGVVSGICQGIADDGALLLETSIGVQKYYGGALRQV